MKMKFIALAIAGSLISLLGQGQIKKGSLLFGGSLGYNSIKQNSKTTNPVTSYELKREDIIVSPSFAMAVANNLFVGADLSWNTNTDKFTTNDMTIPGKIKSSTKGGGVFVRKYWNIADRFYIFGQGRLGYDYFNRDYATNPPNIPTHYEKGHILSASVYPGLSFALSKKVHLESTFLNLVTVQYAKRSNYAKQNDQKLNKDSYFDVISSFDNATSFTIGVKVLLSK